MKSVTRSLGHAAAAVLGSGAVMLAASATAIADPPPNCTSADVIAVMAGVSTNMSAYLFTHPDVNAFFTGMHGQPKAMVAQKTKDFLNQNPQVNAEISAIRAPAVDLRNRCNIPLKAEISGVL